MPLSTVCVSTVSSRPRAWSSYTNIRAKDVKQLTSMNSAEEISNYREVGGHYYSPTLNRRFLGYGYDFPEKSPKKEKKWSIGSFFRRKKKDDSDSSSEEDIQGQKKGFLNRKKRKPEKKRKSSAKPTGFDHVVISRNSHLYQNGFTTSHEDHGILSDPSGGFNSYSGRVLPRSQENLRKPIVRNSHESLEISAGSGSIDSLAVRKSRKDLAKVRAEARRINMRHDSSSDEDSQKSAASSSRFRSDENLGGGNLHREGSVSRRSRAARTERYFKRHSRDGENPKDYLRISKSDAENSLVWKNSDDSNRSLSRSPLVPKSKVKTSYSSLSSSQTQSISGLSTIPPSHGSHNKIRVSNSTSNPSYKPPLSMNEYNNTSRKLPNDYFNNQRSISCDANIHKSPSVEIEPEIMHVQFPLGKPNNRYRNLSLIDTRLINSARQPPPPPPRDPRRLVTAQYYENGRPNTYYFDGSQNRSKSFHSNSSGPPPTVYSPQTRKKNSYNLHTGRSTSEDYLPKNNIQLIQRPSSVTPDASSRRFIQRPLDVQTNMPENYNYLTDKKPRSRKPIFIQTSKSIENPDKSGTKKALDFWKQKDREGTSHPNIKPNSKSPQMFTCQTHVQTQVFLPSVLQNDINNDNLISNSTDSLLVNEPVESVSPFKPITSQESNSTRDEIDSTAEEFKHKSTNLEEALDELEAIYNSLRLGDEDLLERAEQREKAVQAERLREKQPEAYWAMSRGALSDSSFSYEPFDTVDSPRRRRLLKKSQTVDRRGDDMAFRKLNKERSATINDPQSVISKVSYLQASPLYGRETSNDFETPTPKSDVPDVTLDDVVYRNIKFANIVPKVVETQPPFGIPVGPITKAANSDYLHAVPDSNFAKPREIPDLVKDDLAYRNLRKDQGKEPALPPLSPDDVKNNNASNKFDVQSMKKKRAVRSLSANIGSLINKDVLARGLERYKENNNANNEFSDLSNIADAMEIARQVLKEKENKINATRRGFLSDNDTNNGNCEVKESRMNFLNSLKDSKPTVSSAYLNARPPRGLTPERKSSRSPKESTPIPLSPMEEKPLDGSHDSSLDDLLTALATEARETNDRINNELKHFGAEKSLKQLNSEDNVHKQLSDIEAVSEQAKQCEKLLEGVVDSDLMAAEEQVEQIDDEPVVLESVANIVLTRDDTKIDSSKTEKDACESDHDYENLKSDEELNFNVIRDGADAVKKCTSPFEEHKAELIASFQELKKNVEIDMPSHSIAKTEDDGEDEKEEEEKLVTGKHSPRRSRSRLPRWLRPHSCGNLSDPTTTMSAEQEGRAQRIARYKEERRKELAAQFQSDSLNNKRNNKDGANSSSSEGPRTTRTSRLRAAAASAQENFSSPNTQVVSKLKTLEKHSSSPETNAVRRAERDKSSKRKSNLNRSLNSEEVPASDIDDAKSRRRRRRFFPQDVLDEASRQNGTTSDTSATLTASFLSQSSTSPITASPRSTPRKSELSIHMENARKSITPSYCEMGKHNKSGSLPRRAITSSPKERPKGLSSSDMDNSQSDRDISYNSKNSSNKENISRSRLGIDKVALRNKSCSDNDVARANKNIAKKMEELTALTKETLARVERLASKNRDSPKQVKKLPAASSSPIKQTPIRSRKSGSVDRQLTQPSSILKRTSFEENFVEPVNVVPTGPVSILKRKISQDEHNKSEGTPSTTHTPPVTFSPSVVEPATTNRRQGILKKRRSLDESQVMRHRSCSPNKQPDSPSILKNQRRSSLEELPRTESPEPHLHGILKRKPSRSEDDDQSLNSPQSILKRRSGASSAGSTGSTPHVSITTAVILAAAGGAEMVLEESDSVRPILKKKSFSEEHSFDSALSEAPKPILKKKSSTDTDEGDERPKKPILKVSRTSVDRDSFDKYNSIPSDNDSCDVRPILKQNGAVKEDAGLRPRLSFSNDRNCASDDVKVRPSRRSHTICADFNVHTNLEQRDEDRQLKKPRPLSVLELVMSFESSTSTGAIPKRSNGNKRHSDRYRTQPVTSNELEASLNLVRSPHQLEKSSPLGSPNANHNSLLDFTSSLENDSDLNSFLTSLHHTAASPDSGVCGKMSSDSAFQSLGDGLELDQDDDDKAEISSISAPRKLEPNKLDLQMKAIAEEAKKFRLGKGNVGLSKYSNRKSASTSSSSRFSTQPVTFEEVQEAAKLNPEDDRDPANLSLSERIKLFNVKVKENVVQKRDVPRQRLNRFQTQPVTSDEVESARFISPATNHIDTGNEHRRGILKSASGKCANVSPVSQRKSVLKKRDSLKIDIPDVTYDEGISCNDSASDSESVQPVKGSESNPVVKLSDKSRKVVNNFGKSNGDTTSDGESSGGREIRSIFRNEKQLKLKSQLESVLSKSKSHSTFGDESGSTNRKGTTTIRRSQTQAAMPRSIAEIQAELQQSGESGWKKRIQQNNKSDELLLLKDKNRYNDELSEKSSLAARKDELDASSQKWKNRVEKSDAEKFSVAGRMEKNTDGNVLPINIPIGDNNNKKPQAKRFKSKEVNYSSSTPVSPDKAKHHDLSRSYSVPDPDQDSSGSDSSVRASGRKVSIPRPDDFTFTNFYKTSTITQDNNEQLEVTPDDFDAVTRGSLLVQKKIVCVQRKRTTSKNPIKALASRSDISNEYTEIITGVAEREKKRLNIEKLAKGSSLGVEALAALASKEDFKSVELKKSKFVSDLVPFKPVMLLQIKGRRQVQTRLVEPTAASINEGDNFILVTGSTLYCYNGAYANIIEQSRTTDILNHIQQSGDLGCKSAEIVTIDAKHRVKTSKTSRFWQILGCDETHTFTDGGHPDEDEIYENNMRNTNMVYQLDGDELEPYEKYCGVTPKIEMLEANQVLVFDFGTEMYVWSGKNAPSDKKKLALGKAKELWENGYDYTNCNVCPLNVAVLLGNRRSTEVALKGSKRPEWALFARITQHRETILFKEKFLDWPDFSRVIRVKGDGNEKNVDPSYNITACNVAAMLKVNDSAPDLIVEGHHLGRGKEYFDEETNRLFEFDTNDISVWRILEHNSEKVCDKSIGHFYNGDSYIIRWNYKMTVRGRELSGKPSKHIQAGRDRTIYFCWQGSNASINEKGYAALLTVELDSENAPQVRVAHGYEPAAFLRLFNGDMVVHCGKRGDDNNSEHPRLFMIRGERPSETALIEVPCEIKQIRSRTSFLLFNGSKITVWHGAKSSRQTRKMIKEVVNRIIGEKAPEFFPNCDGDDDVQVENVEEGEESSSFLRIVGRDRNSYMSLLNNDLKFDYTMRLFCLSSISGTFQADEVLCPYRSEFSSPYPFLQNDLYSASQPALFLIDNHHELWLWQGWWPEREEVGELSDQTGSGAVRWQQERKAAMQTAVDYWRKSHPGDETMPAYLVWSGLEPLEFRNLFPDWTDFEDVTELNLKEGKKPNAKLFVEKELTLLSRTTYALEELLDRPLPEGVDPTHLEIYLSPEDFQELLSMTKEEFQKLPAWKQTSLKKEKGLF